MTRGEILKMPTGREMDAVIAECVMGEPEPLMAESEVTVIYMSLLRGYDVPHSAGGAWYATMDFEDGDTPYWEPCHFSTNIAKAWRVVEKLMGFVFGVDVCVNHADGWWCRVKHSDGGLTTATADTAPLAICRAALLAVSEATRGN